MEEIAGHDNTLGRTAGCGESQDLGRAKSQVKEEDVTKSMCTSTWQAFPGVREDG